MELKRVALVIADISGYTEFIRFHQGTLLHAEEIISQLLETVIDKVEYPLTLNKLEGDAALMYAELENVPQDAVRDVVRQVRAFFPVFRAKTYELSGTRSACPCEACQRIRGLRLKAVVHEGEVAVKQIRQFEEIAGEAVIMVHRLLKNTVPADEYILMTEGFYRLAGALPRSQSEERVEVYRDLGQVKVRVFYPQLTDE